ncbi:MAG: NAD(P)/FAD-dependent oxidoreductase [Leptolyngbyaceae cyanobacterium MO_188.B28]|nr:NAD(P)/FAD-dependent oxidoreductase [Leptolyngbyaceae cyanobacterium MO_188.B28]
MSIQPSLTTQSPSSRRNVLIVGGGPAGLAVALMLAKRNWTEITVLEKRMAADYYEPDKSFNYLIDGRGQKFTDLLGLTEQLSAIGVPNTEFYLTRIQPNGSRKTLKTPLIAPTRKPAYWLTRRAFMQLLYQEIQQNWSDQVTVLFNTRCVAINKGIRNGFETLEVLIEDENPSRLQRFEPGFLIGCDGLHSIVRSTINTWDHSGKFEMQQFPSPSSGLRYKVLSLPPNFPLDAEGKERALSTMSYAIRGIFREQKRALSLGLLPLKDPEAPRTANLITYPEHQLWRLKTPEEVLNFLDHAFPQLPLRQIILPEEIERFANSNGGAFPVPQFCSGLYHPPDTKDAEASKTTAPSVLLLGDAVHCFPPDIGQGVNSALEDVFVFYQILEENEDDLTRSLPRYEAVRLPDVRAVVRLAQVAAPWQYNQDPLRGKLWTIAFIFRLGLSKFLLFISPPAFVMIQNHNLSYHEIWLRNQRTTRILSVMSLIVFIGLWGAAVLLLNR